LDGHIAFSLGLQNHGVYGRVRRLGGDLCFFDSRLLNVDSRGAGGSLVG
jgi:hypothetical protein